MPHKDNVPWWINWIPVPAWFFGGIGGFWFGESFYQLSGQQPNRHAGAAWPWSAPEWAVLGAWFGLIAAFIVLFTFKRALRRQNEQARVG